MEGEDEASEDDRSFSKASIPKRIAICAAGAIVNIIFAVVVYFIVLATSGVYISNVVDSTIPEYAAEQAGIQSGDVIVELNGEKVENKYDLDDIMQNATGEDILVKVERNGENLEFNVKPTEVQSKVTGMYLDDKCQVIMVDKGSSSEKQGIQANDVITKINNVETNGDTNKIMQLLVGY